MKILVVASGNHAQVASFVTEQAAALRVAGRQVELFCVKGRGLLGYLRNLKPLKNAIKSFSPNVIHAHYGLCGLLCTLQRNVPVVVTYHGSDINNPAMLQFSRLAMRRSAHNIFVSKKLKTNGLEISKSRCLKVPASVIPCGIDTEVFRPMDRDEACRLMKLNSAQHYILFAGSFDNEVKNPQLAKQAFSLFSTHLPVENRNQNGGESLSSSSFIQTSRQPDIRLSEHPNITFSSSSSSFSTHLLELKGYCRTEVAALMNVADCLLMTSHSEGSPQVVKEALSCGCPVVSVDVGDVAEQIEGTGCGMIVERTPEAIAKALSIQIERPRPTCSIEKTNQFDNRWIAAKIIETYKTVIG